MGWGSRRIVLVLRRVRVLVGQSRRPKQGQKHEMELCFCSISINFGFCSLIMVACGHKYLMLKFKSVMMFNLLTNQPP